MIRKLRPGERGQFVWGVGTAHLSQEAWQSFLSRLHLFFIFSSFIRVKVLKFCSCSVLPGGHVEEYLKFMADKLTRPASAVAALTPRDLYPRLCAPWAAASRGLPPSLPMLREGGEDGGRER